MLGKASEIKTHCLESWFGSYPTEEVSMQMNRWLESNPSAIVIQTTYATYQAMNADDLNAYGERLFIIYKEDESK